VLSGLDLVRVEVEVEVEVEAQKVLQGLRVANKNTSTDLWVGEGEAARRIHDSRRYGDEIDLIYNQNRVRTESSTDHRE
jgi:hypothetical protein